MPWLGALRDPPVVAHCGRFLLLRWDGPLALKEGTVTVEINGEDARRRRCCFSMWCLWKTKNDGKSMKITMSSGGVLIFFRGWDISASVKTWNRFMVEFARARRGPPVYILYYPQQWCANLTICLFRILLSKIIIRHLHEQWGRRQVLKTVQEVNKNIPHLLHLVSKLEESFESKQPTPAEDKEMDK